MLFASGASSTQELRGQCWSTFTAESRSHANKAEIPLTFTSKLSTLQSYKPSAAIQPRGRDGKSTAVSTPNCLPLHTSSIAETCFHPLHGGCLWAVPHSQHTSSKVARLHSQRRRTSWLLVPWLSSSDSNTAEGAVPLPGAHSWPKYITSFNKTGGRVVRSMFQVQELQTHSSLLTHPAASCPLSASFIASMINVMHLGAKPESSQLP